jgi:hypothetical protein
MNRKPRPQPDECGCTHNGHAWLKLCDKHEAEHAEFHRIAMEDYRRTTTHPTPKEMQS